jgi:hypothetical protein
MLAGSGIRDPEVRHSHVCLYCRSGQLEIDMAREETSAALTQRRLMGMQKPAIEDHVTNERRPPQKPSRGSR